MVSDQVTLQVRPAPYLIAHLHLARVWSRQLWEEYEWFIMSMRGQLPPPRKPVKNYQVHHVHLPPKQYYAALEALTTRLGVKLT